MVRFKKAYFGVVAGTRWNVDQDAHFNLSDEEAAKIELDSPGTIEHTGATETKDTPRPVTREAPAAEVAAPDDFTRPTKTVKADKPLKLTATEKKALAQSTGDDAVLDDDGAEATVRDLKVPPSDRMVRGASNRAEATQDASAPGAVSLSPETVAKTVNDGGVAQTADQQAKANDDKTTAEDDAKASATPKAAS
jgi:hypothetical protein